MVHGIVVISFNKALSTQSHTFVFLSDFQILQIKVSKVVIHLQLVGLVNAVTKTILNPYEKNER